MIRLEKTNQNQLKDFKRSLDRGFDGEFKRWASVPAALPAPIFLLYLLYFVPPGAQPARWHL